MPFPYLPVFEADEIPFSVKLKPLADLIAMDIHCLFWDANRSSTRQIASYPGTRHGAKYFKKYLSTLQVLVESKKMSTSMSPTNYN